MRSRGGATPSHDTVYPGDLTSRQAAIVAGLGLLVMAILAGFANFAIFQKLVVPGDPATTAQNIVTSAGLFRIGICSFLVVAVLDVVVAWALYVFLKPVHPSLSLLAAWFRVVYAGIFAVAMTYLFSALQLLSGADYLKAMEPSQLQSQALLAIDAFHSGWDLGLVVFGLHLFLVAYLVFRSGYVPKWLGVLLAIAALGYVVDSFGKFLVPGYNVSIAQFTFLGEVLLMFWLLWKGIRGLDRRP